MAQPTDQLTPIADDFFARDATVVAPLLIGATLVLGHQAVRISEVEAYTNDDPASHSYRGRTARNAVMFGPSGVLYVYLIYGLHHCLNVVTGTEGDGQAVLIRAGLIDGVDARSTRGPGRLAKVVGADLTWNGRAVRGFIHISAGADDVGLGEVLVTPRIGITKAADLLRRWVVVAQ